MTLKEVSCNKLAERPWLKPEPVANSVVEHMVEPTAVEVALRYLQVKPPGESTLIQYRPALIPGAYGLKIGNSTRYRR